MMSERILVTQEFETTLLMFLLAGVHLIYIHTYLQL